MMGYIKSREENVAFNCEYTKMLLQLCAVMSQNNLYYSFNSDIKRLLLSLKKA